MDYRDLKGRRKIYTDEREINEKNIIKVLNEALIDHTLNRVQIEYLLNYEKGKQPILDRVKDIRPEINEKLVENNAAKIVDFKVGYEFGSPILYVQRAKEQTPKTEETKDDKCIAYLNAMAYEESKASKDVQLAKIFKTCGVGYRMISPKKGLIETAVFDITNLNPMNTFIVYTNDIFQRPILAVTYWTMRNGGTTYACYAEGKYYEIDNGTRIKDEQEIKGEPKIKGSKGLVPSSIPIVEYVNDSSRMGCFERVIPILDKINIVNSDRVNDIAQHVQSLLWMNNCEIEESQKDKVRSDGLIMTKNPSGTAQQANIKYLETILNQQETQVFVDYLQEQAMQIAGCPTKADTGGGSTGSAMNLSTGYQTAEALAKASETLFEESERQALNVMLEIIRTSNDIDKEVDMSQLKLADIVPKFSRNKTYDLATKCNALSTLLGCGIDGLRAIEVVGLFTDPEQTWLDSKDLIEELQKTKQNKENTPLQSISTEEQPSKVANVDQGV